MKSGKDPIRSSTFAISGSKDCFLDPTDDGSPSEPVSEGCYM